MFQIFKDKGLLFQETTLAMSLADGQQTTGEALTTEEIVEIEGRTVLTKFIILPKAKGNRTLLGTDFLSSAGLVLDVKNTCWYFWDNPTTSIHLVLLRYGIPRRLISDNGTQFVSAVMQQICYLLNIHQSLIPVYHPQANPVERKNRDLNPRLAILVQDKHGCLSEKLPSIRFALNTAKRETTGRTAAFLNFGRVTHSN
ncbi:transposon Tf2-8 polyprotein [Trichonephila clavipes]|nr:transposon Tf2-8 polyprotein [Trichonephila clavipes]